MTAKDFRERALEIFRGTGVARTADGIVDEIAQALATAYEAGRKAGAAERRESALREMLAITAGMRAYAEHRETMLRRELEEHQRATGRVTT